MATPEYMSVLQLVAKQHGGLTDLDQLGEDIRLTWAKFEKSCAQVGYDVLSSYYGDEHMVRLVEFLYRVPGVDWRRDCETLRSKDKEYGGSWCRRGGQGAFAMVARKFDRIDNAIQKFQTLSELIAQDQREEGVLDDLQDMRCYLLLILSWRYAVANPETQAALPLT